MKQALARLQRGGEFCAEPARRPSWLRVLGATFLVAFAAGLPATLAAGTAAAASSAATAGNGYCGSDGFVLSAFQGQKVGAISLSWCEPAGDPNAPFGYYIDEGTSHGNESTTVNASPFPDTTTSYDVPGLTGGMTYYFVIKAVNSLNRSVSSTEAWATAPTGTYDGTGTSDGVSSPPPAPTQLSASPGDSQVSLSWIAPSPNGSSPLTYRVYDGTSQDSGSLTLAESTSDTSATVTGLTNGTTYYFVVTAVDAVGESSWSEPASATPSVPPPSSSPPPAPTQLSASPGDSQVSLSWIAPSPNGSSPLTYRVYDGTSQDSGSLTLAESTSDTSATVTGLTNGTTYYFVVTAVNAVGESSRSEPASATPSVPPQGGGGSGVGQSGGQSGGESAPPSSSPLVPAVASGVGILVLVGSVIAVRRLRARPRPPAAPQSAVQVVGNAGPPGRVRVYPTGTQPTVAVRIEPHPGAGTTLIEEIRR